MLSTLCALVLAVSLGGCASGSSELDGGGGGNIDGAINPNDDARVSPVPDASTTPTPDAQQQGTPDAGSTCANTPCDLVQQCGCGVTQVCDLDANEFATGGTRCRDVMTPGNEDDDCTGGNDCAGGFVCIGGTCRKWCGVSGDCEGEGGLCIVQLTFGTPATDIPGAVTCTRSCEPELATANGCPPSEGACHIYQFDPDGTPDNGDEELLTDCDPAGAVGNDGTCTNSTSCQAGYECVNTGSLVCKQNCQCPTPGNCAGGACTTGTCSAYSTPLLIGATEYGVCL